MKTIILMPAMALTVPFPGPVSDAPRDTPDTFWPTTYQVVEDTLIVDASGNGSYSFGSFTVTHHAEVDLVTRSAKGAAEFTSPNGDILFTSFAGQGIDTGIVNESYVTEILAVTGGTGRFAAATGHFTGDRLLDS